MLKEILTEMAENYTSRDIEEVLDKNDFFGLLTKELKKDGYDFSFELEYGLYDDEDYDDEGQDIVIFTVKNLTYTDLAADYNNPSKEEKKKTLEVIEEYIYKTLKKYKSKFKEVFNYEIEVNKY